MAGAALRHEGVVQVHLVQVALDPARFVRVHRGYFVNLDYLAEIEPLETGDARLQIRDGVKIPCSRHRAALRERFGRQD